MQGTIEQLVAAIGAQSFDQVKCPLKLRVRVVREAIEVLGCWHCIERKTKPYNFSDWFTRSVSGHYLARPGKETVGAYVKELIAEIAPHNPANGAGDRLRLLLFHYLKGLWINYEGEGASVYSCRYSIYVPVPRVEMLTRPEAEALIRDANERAARGEISSQLIVWRTLMCEALLKRKPKEDRQAVRFQRKATGAQLSAQIETGS